MYDWTPNNVNQITRRRVPKPLVLAAVVLRGYWYSTYDRLDDICCWLFCGRGCCCCCFCSTALALSHVVFTTTTLTYWQFRPRAGRHRCCSLLNLIASVQRTNLDRMRDVFVEFGKVWWHTMCTAQMADVSLADDRALSCRQWINKMGVYIYIWSSLHKCVYIVVVRSLWVVHRPCAAAEKCNYLR